ncbi:hydroxymethylpyrimidine pyrophosphatase-like HAD family hydrolase [Roseimicrobium gellanilyticum]|uniref:Hydroxymethylpyrimidine pyrophosphatase-like HAD family hydrolase n=1 Tax=Roseimicrobium gellanilyticum TaxID=748857 RepID=A0A366HPS4_9BACT|nr:hypothetical protein [Roseimicrobium gellanilyticum]RBP44605.1 hydroxymethylpyrimidine pyrophosphatase-like HAD family hydrolase [Roseimicrobium gellanilyticum]
MKTRDWIATDLDGTLFSREFAVEGAIPATWKKDAAGDVPSSWVHPATYRLMRALGECFDLVPVTARDLDSYSRVKIEGLTFRGAVLANGAIIIDPDGNIDESWNDVMGGVLESVAPELQTVCRQVAEQSRGLARARLVASGTEHAAYLVAKADEAWWGTPEGVHLLQTLEVSTCRAALLKNELQVLPPGVSKSIGLAAYQQRYGMGNPPLMGLGDMPTDMEFMRECSFLGIPSGSRLEQSFV